MIPIMQKLTMKWLLLLCCLFPAGGVAIFAHADSIPDTAAVTFVVR